VHFFKEGVSPVLSDGSNDMLRHADDFTSSPTIRNHDVPLQHLRDLETARQVQRNLFPRELPCVHGWDLAAVCRPARVVAGDYHDLFTPAPGFLTIALGDVAGKGLGPALVMAHLHTLIRSRLPAQLADLAGLVADLNAHLLAVLPEEMFVTLFLAVVELDTGRMRYVNAGHPSPILICPGVPVAELAEGGTILGILPGSAVMVGEVWLPPGCMLTVFSDGVTEAEDPKGEQFQLRRVRAALHKAGDSSAAAIVERLVVAVEGFAGRTEPADDVSLVIVRREPHTHTS
jgi:sigma-B regulation protein RsbU (phosphoserine phosphatase)